MSTLQALFAQKKPYGSVVRVKIISQGTGSNSNRYGVADSTMAAELVVYDESKVPKIHCGHSIMMINATTRQQPRKTIQVGRNTRVSKTGLVDVPEALEKQARDIVNPKPATFVSLSEAKTSPLKTLMSVRGQVVGQEMVETVMAQGSEVDVKNITIKENGETCRVALWRNNSSADVTLGDVLQLTNVVTKEYQEEPYLSSTRQTQVKKIDHKELTEQAEVIAYEVEGDWVLLTTSQKAFPVYKIEATLLRSAWFDPGHAGEDDVEDIDELLSRKVPFKCQFVSNEKHIDSFSLIVE